MPRSADQPRVQGSHLVAVDISGTNPSHANDETANSPPRIRVPITDCVSAGPISLPSKMPNHTANLLSWTAVVIGGCRTQRELWPAKRKCSIKV